MQPIIRESIVERRQSHLRWSAILGGSAVAIGLWILLQVFGMGVGLASIDTDDAGSLRGVGIGTGIWSLIAPMIAVFGGALITGRIAATYDRTLTAIHGAVTWAITMIAGTWMLVTIVTMLASGAARVGGAAAGAASNVVAGTVAAGGQVDVDKAMSTLGVDADDLLAPVNQRLQREGKPPVTAAQLSAAMRGVARHSLRQGHLDRQLVVDELARNTALNRADAQDLAARVEARYDELVADVEQAGRDAKHAALDAADSTGKVMMLGGFLMLLSLSVAMGGALLAVHRRRDLEPVVVTPVTPRPDLDRRVIEP